MLNELLQKDQSYDWTPTRQLAFDKLKQRFMEEPVLLLSDQTQPFQIESDAFKYASGAVLMQTNINGDSVGEVLRTDYAAVRKRCGRAAEGLRKTNKKDLASTYVLRLRIT